MTGVPGGDVTLQAAITAELDLHRPCPCGCGECEAENNFQWRPSHAAERIMAVLADRLPHTPADQLAALIGGTVERGVGWTRPGAHEIRVVTPWVPDSPPAAPEPACDHTFRLGVCNWCAASEPGQDT